MLPQESRSHCSHAPTHIKSSLLWAASKSGPTLCDPMNCSRPGFPVLHYLPELNSRPMSWWCYVTISFFATPFSSRLPSFPSNRVFSNESAPHISWYWSFSFSLSPSNEYSGLISFRMDWFGRLAVHWTLKSLLQHHNFQKHQFFSAQPSLRFSSHIHTWLQVPETPHILLLSFQFEPLRTHSGRWGLHYRRTTQFSEGGQMHRSSGLGLKSTFLLQSCHPPNRPFHNQFKAIKSPCMTVLWVTQHLGKLTMETEILKYASCNHFINI